MAGRKGKYEEWLTDEGLLSVEGWAREGAADKDIAEKIGISVSTICDWKNRFPEFSSAIKKGRAPVDFKVENALLKRALGYEWEETTTEITEIPYIDSHGNLQTKQEKHIKTVKRHVAPEPVAIIYWLNNRKPVQWRNKREVEQKITPDDPLLKLLSELDKQAEDDNAIKQTT